MKLKTDATIPSPLKNEEEQKHVLFVEELKKRENVENRLFIVVLRSIKCQYISIIVGDELEVQKI